MRIEPVPPPIPPLDLTLLPAVRETALKLGILVPLRDRLRPQYSLGHFCSEQGSAELFLERSARDHQQQRLQSPAFDRWCRELAQPMEDPTPIEYPELFHRGWWRRWRHRKGWSEGGAGATQADLDADPTLFSSSLDARRSGARPLALVRSPGSARADATAPQLY